MLNNHIAKESGIYLYSSSHTLEWKFLKILIWNTAESVPPNCPQLREVRAAQGAGVAELTTRERDNRRLQEIQVTVKVIRIKWDRRYRIMKCSLINRSSVVCMTSGSHRNEEYSPAHNTYPLHFTFRMDLRSMEGRERRGFYKLLTIQLLRIPFGRIIAFSTPGTRTKRFSLFI